MQSGMTVDILTSIFCRLEKHFRSLGIQSKKISYILTHLTQYTVLEIQFWSVKYTTVTVGYAKVSSNVSFLPIQVTQAITYNG